jgi:pimeloyl-ACP methyl ester carboxylesterase
MSDMTGDKALALEEFCRTEGHAFLRFDYGGHGQSSGDFADGTIGSWTDDALAALDHLSEGPQILVGSSMGGWIMALVALARPERVAGLLGIAAAPDFTIRLWDEELSTAQKDELTEKGFILMPNDYDAPYTVTRQLIEDGRTQALLGGPIPIRCPVRLLHGLEDTAVPWQTALKIQEKLDSDDVEVMLIKNGDHRLSEDDDLERLRKTLGGLLHRAG